ncbi:hypothetical protein DO315_24520 [Salmonella enterica]|nr:hypothetical protein [Salmonella enterica]
MDIHARLNKLQMNANSFTKQLGIKDVKVCFGKFTGYRYFRRRLMFSLEFVQSLPDRHLQIILAHEIGHAFHGMSISSFFNGRCYFDEMKADLICKLLTGADMIEWKNVIHTTARFYPGMFLNPVEYTTRKQAFI